MYPRSILLLLMLAGAAFARMADHQGFSDPALFTRMPNYFLPAESSVADTPFEAYEFLLSSGSQRVEGHHLHYDYVFDEESGAKMPGFLQIVRNYTGAAKRIGGQVLYEDDRRAVIKLARNGSETWVAVEGFNDGREYELNIIEKQAMQQDVVASAAALKAGLAENGHVEAPGIFFDFGKSDLKPESEPALKEIAGMLQSNPRLKVWVVGHTDNVGSAESNVALSGARAASVVRVLVQKGIDHSRLGAQGAGPYAPIASNASDSGRARNRRVELVAQP